MRNWCLWHGKGEKRVFFLGFFGFFASLRIFSKSLYSIFFFPLDVGLEFLLNVTQWLDWTQGTPVLLGYTCVICRGLILCILLHPDSNIKPLKSIKQEEKVVGLEGLFGFCMQGGLKGPRPGSGWPFGKLLGWSRGDTGVCARLFSRVQLSCNPMDYSLPGSSVHGISLARILEWVASSFSRGSSRLRGQTHVSCIAGVFFTTEPPGKPARGDMCCRRLQQSRQYSWLLSLLCSNVQCRILFTVILSKAHLTLYSRVSGSR